MAIQETIKAGKKLRRYVDGAWERLSFWHKASDCEMDNGNNLEKEIQDIKNLIQNTKTDLKTEIKTENDDMKKHILVYNENSDYYQGYIDGQWQDVVYAGLNFDGYLIKDGAINDNFCSGLMYNSSLPLQAKSYCDTVITKPYIDGIHARNTVTSFSPGGSHIYYTQDEYSNSNFGITTTVLDHLACYTYVYSASSFVGRAAGSLFSALPIRLDNYNTVTIEYNIRGISEGKNTQILSFGFTKQPHADLWFEYLNAGYEIVFNEVQNALPILPSEERETLQLDISDLKGYGYFTISLINPNSMTSMLACIYNIKFE